MIDAPLQFPGKAMEYDYVYFEEKKNRAKQLYFDQKTIYSPYFKEHIILNSDGFHHLQFSYRKERNTREQLLKFRLMPMAFEIIRKAGTLQEYRKILSPVGNRSVKNDSVAMRLVEYWGFVAIIGSRDLKIKVILRRVGDGNIIFWSVMPYSKIKNGKQRLFSEGIEDE